MPIPIRPELKIIQRPKFKSLEELNRYKKLCLWLPIPTIRKNVPWGYYLDPSNSKVALPDEKALLCFIKADEYLQHHSYTVVCDWLKSCGYPITEWGLIKILRNRPVWEELNLPIEERMKL